MKKILSFIRFKYKKKISFGIIENKIIYEIDRNFLDKNFKKTGKNLNLESVKILPPVQPSKIIFLAYNYKDLVGYKKKYNEPLIGIKSPNAIITHNEKIIINQKRKTWIEVELAIIVKSKCKNLNILNAKKYIFGHTIGNDVTMQNIHKRDHHLARSKSHDTFCPIGPFITTNLDTSNLRMNSYINGKLFQKGNTKNRIYDDVKSMVLVTKYFTLFPGDIILTGTPANAENSIISNNSIIELQIEKIGKLKNIAIINE